MKSLHSLLKRQIKRHLPHKNSIPPDMEPFINAVNEAYRQMDLDRKMLERSLELSSDELFEANSETRAILRAIPDLLIRLDGSGRILDWKESENTDFTADPRKMIGKKIRDIPDNPMGDQFQKVFDRLRERKSLISIDYSMTLQGREKHFEARLVPFLDDQVIAIIRDITERKRTEEDLHKARKLESVGTLAGGIAHDFNNLLTVIQGYVELAQLGLPVEGGPYTTLQAAIEAINQAADLSRRLITFSKGGGPIKRPSDIGEIVKDSFQRSVSGLIVQPFEKKCLIAEDLWKALVDEGQLRQVVRNMVLNAMEAMPEGGLLKVNAENYTKASDEDSLPVPEGYYVRIAFEDTGRGIPGDRLPHIFDPYFTTKQMGSLKGMGLGLSVCHSIVVMHGGCITVESSPGAGTVFHVYLPAISNIDESSMKNLKEKKPLLRKRILVMDDVSQLRELISHLLSAMGYEVETAADGAEALDLYVKALASGNSFDMVMLDLTVKSGLGGLQTIENLVRVDPHVKAVILSGYSNDPAVEKYSDYGFLGALKKPFKKNELEDVLEKIL